ncbi:ATP-binding protein [Streptomyces sp. YGL11-2]|uniref:ATP-binding protein n=1 Tax=Streptomyces sp. YGL11-2 TaxID=3414028 RepID=UPI003CFA8334
MSASADAADAGRPAGAAQALGPAEATGPGAQYAPHPYLGGRTAALRALAAWRMRWPGAPRVVVVTGSPGSGRSRLVAGFLMLCDPEYRKRLPLDNLDPATVPPDLPAPAVPDPRGRTSAQVLWLLADHLGLAATRTEDIFTELAAREEPVTVVVPDVDLAGPVRPANEPARLIRDVLTPLAATPTVRLLADVPRELAAELAAAAPGGQVQVIDLDEPEWADPEGLVLHAETALTPEAGAPDLPYTTDPDARRALAEALARRAGGSRLTVHLAVRSLFALPAPDDVDPTDASQLPATVGEVLDLHARRLGAEPLTLRQMLAPLAFAEGDGLPVELWRPLASAVAGHDMGPALAEGMLLAAPFIEPVEQAEPADTDGAAGDGSGNGSGGRTLLRLVHPVLAAEVRSGLADARDAQTRIAMALLQAVPQQNWSLADPYVRDYLAAHTLDAGLLPQLLTDPGLFAHADPVALRAAVEAVPPDQLGAPAHTYLRTAPLLTRSGAPAEMRAALLETAFVEDGLQPYADALHGLGFNLPWRTLWSLPLAGVVSVAPAFLQPQVGGEGGKGGGEAAGGSRPVAALVVPAGTPGARPLPDSDTALLLHDLLRPGHLDADAAQMRRPSEDEQTASPYGLSRGADYLRVWARESGEVVTALLSDTPFRDADLSPEGVLLVATERGVTARQITAPAPAPVPELAPERRQAPLPAPSPEAGPGAVPTLPAQATGTAPAADAASQDRPQGVEGDHS